MPPSRLLPLVAALVVAASLPPAATRAVGDPNLARAVASYTAMQRFFYRPRLSEYAETSVGRGRTPAQAWPYSQALAATLALARADAAYRTDALRRLRDLGGYWNARLDPPGYDSALLPPRGSGGPEYYDDNEWIGLDLVSAYETLSRPAALHRAAQVFRLVLSGWDADDSHACPGGVYWARDGTPDHRNTVSTANGALLGLRLARATNQGRYVRWADRMWDWMHECLRAPNGLFWDHLDSHGVREPTQWSYNQGAMIAVATLLYQATGDREYLAEAHEIADAALAYFEPRLAHEPPEFVAIFFHDLLLLDAVDSRPAYVSAVEEYAARAWSTVRDPHTGLFRFDRGRPVQLLQQAAMVQIYADLALADA
jgi:hypothetical protein